MDVTVAPRQGEVWWAESQDKRRPVLVVTRSEAVPVLTWIVVAPVTRSVRGIATEVPLGPSEGLTVDCVASFDNLQPIRGQFHDEPDWRSGLGARRRDLLGARSDG